MAKDNFYEEIFEAPAHVPTRRCNWAADKPAADAPGVPAPGTPEVAKQAAVIQLINAFRVRGHLMADLDPLGAEPAYTTPNSTPSPTASPSGISTAHFSPARSASRRFGGRKPVPRCARCSNLLRETYCGKIGCEYMYIQRPEEKLWLQQRMEPKPNHWPSSTREERLRIFEASCAAKSSNISSTAASSARSASRWKARETAIADSGRTRQSRRRTTMSHEIVIGMAHRGRLNVLANIIGKPLGADLLRVRRQHRSPSARRVRATSNITSAPAASASAVGQGDRRFARRPIPAIWKPSIPSSKAWCAPSRIAWAIPSARA